MNGTHGEHLPAVRAGLVARRLQAQVHGAGVVAQARGRAEHAPARARVAPQLQVRPLDVRAHLGLREVQPLTIVALESEHRRETRNDIVKIN